MKLALVTPIIKNPSLEKSILSNYRPISNLSYISKKLYKKSRIQTWHSPGGIYHNQIDYILVSKRFSTSVNINKTRSFPGADIGSDHDMMMMTFSLHLKNPKKNKFT